MGLVLNIHPVEAGETIYIRATGEVDGTDKIQRNGNVYTFIGNIFNQSIVVEKDNIVVDGAGYAVKGISPVKEDGTTWTGVGVYLDGRSNVTVKNLQIESFFQGILIEETSSSHMHGNRIANNCEGIRLITSSNENHISENNITCMHAYAYGIRLLDSSENDIFKNYIGECTILLENSTSNRIHENDITNGEIGVSRASNNNSIFENKITDGIIGLFRSSHNNSIYRNYVTHHNGDCISLDDESLYNNIFANNITSSGYTGIFLDDWSSYNRMIGNNITNSFCGIEFDDYSSNNTISGNHLANNRYGIIIMYDSKNNIICSNNFINNTDQVLVSSGLSNIWDDGYPSGGNYWSNYTGVDSDHDGIGDTIHVIDESNQDNYPLMGMFSDFDATSEHHVQTVCNSTISDFHFNGTAICFDVTGESGTAGFCRTCIPTTLLNDAYRVFVNGTEILPPPEPLPCSNSTHSYLYFTYNHSTQDVVIIPEFPSVLILPLLIALMLGLAVLSRKKRLYMKGNS